MQVNAAMNSYMLPHGVRCSASPRVRMASTWPVTPMQVRPNASRSQKPDGHRAAAGARRRRAGCRYRPVRPGRRRPPPARPRRPAGAPARRSARRPGRAAGEGEVAGIAQHRERIQDHGAEQELVADLSQAGVDGHRGLILPFGRGAGTAGSRSPRAVVGGDRQSGRDGDRPRSRWSESSGWSAESSARRFAAASIVHRCSSRSSWQGRRTRSRSRRPRLTGPGRRH